MVTTKEKMEFIYVMAKHSELTLAECQRVLRLAATVQRLAETACNRELTKREILKDENVQARIMQIVTPKDIDVGFSGDPRGCTVKLRLPDGYYNNWDGESVGVPA